MLNERVPLPPRTRPRRLCPREGSGAARDLTWIRDLESGAETAAKADGKAGADDA